MTWAGADLPELPRWSRGNILLTGDAAHATLPYLAQGAAMALEDACVLSAKLGDRSDIPSAFAEFSELRFSRASAIQKKSRQLGRIYHAGGVLRRARNAALIAMPLRRFTTQVAWIYDWKPGGR